MTNTNSFHLLGKAIKRSALVWVMPKIKQLPPTEWDEALKQARETNFDTIERIALLAGIAFTTYLLRFEANETEISLVFLFFIQFVAAVPLLILLVGPFYLRCLRRGLDHVIVRRRLAG